MSDTDEQRESPHQPPNGRVDLPAYPDPSSEPGGRSPLTVASANDFAPDSMLHSTAEPPKSGWQRLLFRLTGAP